MIQTSLTGALKILVRGYQLLVSPLFGHNCRYLPSCSAYALEALETHGPATGTWLAAKRVCRCHPWGGSGLDPVPAPDRNGRRQLHIPSDQGSAAASSKG